MRVNVKVEGIEDVNRALKEMGERQRLEFKQEVYASALDIQGQAKDNLKEMGIWDLGNLANSLMAETTGDGLTAEIGPTAPYGPYVEFGTRPHFPPPEALEGWAKRHGFDSAWPICKIIAARGLSAKPYLYPAWLSLVNEFYERIKRILMK